MNRFEEIEVFVRTVEAGSFTSAAESLGVAKSLVSRRVSELEKRVGAQLMVRSTRTLNLTDEGRALYDRAVGVLAEWQEMEALGDAQAGALHGRLRLSMPVSFGLAQFGPVIARFSAQHPNVQCDIQFTDRKVDLIAEGIDLALRIGDLPDSSFKARKISSIAFCICASPAFLRRRGTPGNLDELGKLPEVRFALRDRKRWTVTDPSGAAVDVEMQAGIAADNGDFLRYAAVAGLGVAVLPRFIVEDALLDGTLVELLADHSVPPLSLCAVYPPTQRLPARVRAFIDYLVAHWHGTGATNAK